MRRNRRDSIKKERTIMLISSAFVLAALTMTGLYMRGQEIKEKNDGYTLDFTALENGVDDKLNEIAQNQQAGAEDSTKVIQSAPGKSPFDLEDDLDYMPLEAGSGLVEIPGLTDGIDMAEILPPLKEELKNPVQEDVRQQVSEQVLPTVEQQEQINLQEEPAIESAPQSIMAKELHFSEAERLLRPVDGEVILPYSMDKSVYFTTLDQYKRNPATIFEASEGTEVLACAAGKVVRIFDDAEIGHAVVVDLGDGYQAIYGQLTDIQVREENYIEAGDRLGTVAAPTKYYTVEGANLYFRLEKDGQALDPGIQF